MGPIRGALLWQAVLDALAEAGGEALTVLDLGGGTGGGAVGVASLGHHVTVVDPSPDALASLARRAAEAGVQITAALGDTGDLVDHVDPASVDLVICHGVLDHVDDPDQALAAVASVLRPGAVVSLLVGGRVAAVTARVAGGDFRAAAELMAADVDEWDLASLGPRRYLRSEVEHLVARHGLTAITTRGVRVFSDVVPSSIVDLDPGARDALITLERSAGSLAEFTESSGGLQTLARLDLLSHT